jgi:hypothetical protein
MRYTNILNCIFYRSSSAKFKRKDFFNLLSGQKIIQFLLKAKIRSSDNGQMSSCFYLFIVLHPVPQFYAIRCLLTNAVKSKDVDRL